MERASEPTAVERAVVTSAISGVAADRDPCPAIPYTPGDYAAEAERAYEIRSLGGAHSRSLCGRVARLQSAAGTISELNVTEGGVVPKGDVIAVISKGT